MTKDPILLIESENEAAQLGWTRLGPIQCEECMYGIAWLWCKEDKFVLLEDIGNGQCDFIGFIPREEGLIQLYEYQKALIKIKEKD